jgi:glycosyltransferase involved in cell wall biosynthesis
MIASAINVNSEAVAAPENPPLFKVISVGRFVPLKGFDLAIKAFAQFYNRLHPAQQLSAHCLIIGKGPEKKRMQQIIEKAGLGHVITIKEWMPRSEVINEFKNASVFLFPSHEGAGMVVAEALSYGVPVVCLDNYGPGEYVHPESQLKVSHADYDKTVEQLAEKLVRLSKDHAFADAEKELALKRFEQLFRWPVKRAVINGVYNASFEVTIDPSTQLTLVK